MTAGDPEAAFADWQAPSLSSVMLYEVDSAPRILAGLARNQSVELRDLEVILRGRDDWPAALAAPAFEQLTSLRLSVAGEQVAQLFEGASLPMLTSLELRDDFPIERLPPNLQDLLVQSRRRLSHDLDTGTD